MPIIETDALEGNLWGKPVQQIYNGLDCLLTFEVFEELRTLHNEDPLLYNFERALQAPALDMMQRGFAVDELQRRSAIADVTARIAKLDTTLQRMAYAVWDKPLNPRSHKQLLSFFYGAMRLPESWTSQKGQRKLSMNNETLEKLEVYFHARPIIACIQGIREWKKVLEVLNTGVDSDGRIRTSFNIAGTETGRWSSSANAFGSGCVLPTAEVLTRDGWIAIEKADESVPIAQWNEGVISFVSWKKFRAETGDMLTYKTEQTELTVTRGHRVLHSTYYDPALVVSNAQALSQKTQVKIPLGGKLHGVVSYPTFLPMLMADFSLEKSGWRAAFKKPRKIERFLKLAREFGFSFTEQSAKEGYRRFYIPGYTDLPKQWGSWVLSLDPDCAEMLLEETRYWDSHDRGSGFIFWTADKSQAEWVAVLAHTAGKSATVRRAEQAADSWSTTTMWAVNVKDRDFAIIAKKHWRVIQYEGPVYCPQVPSSYWLVRQNGFISVTGNTNIQNLKKDPDSVEDESDFISIRRLFVADPGKKLCGIDLSQAESREVGWKLGVLFDDWRYLDACYAGDLHTYTCKLIWPKLPWTGEPKTDKDIAEQKFYRHFSYRDMSKKGGHGSNYLGTPFTMARHLKVPKKLMDDFQYEYFQAFPIPRWHRWVAQELQTTQKLTTIFGRTRHFFGRPNDDTTLREAVAYEPQSCTADRMNLAIWRIWKYLPEIELLANGHDAVYFQFDPAHTDTVIPAALALIDTPFTHTSPSGVAHTLSVPGEAKIGWNWGNYNEKLNSDGLRKWKLGEPDTRIRRTGLQRVF